MKTASSSAVLALSFMMVCTPPALDVLVQNNPHIAARIENTETCRQSCFNNLVKGSVPILSRTADDEKRKTGEQRTFVVPILSQQGLDAAAKALPTAYIIIPEDKTKKPELVYETPALA